MKSKDAPPDLPSGQQISYSELNTFDDWCQLQHYYRYYMRMQTKNYGKLRYLTIGSITHDAVEYIYQSGWPKKSYSDQVISSLIEKVADSIFRNYMRPEYRDQFNPEAFAHDKHVAFHLVRVFIEGIYLNEEFDLVSVEDSFEVDLPGVEGMGLLGRKDQDYRIRDPNEGKQVGREIRDYEDREGALPPGRYLGEMKTRGSSFSSRIDTTVEKDFQTDLYLVAAQEEGIDYKGVVYTVLMKPPNDLIFTSDYEGARREIDLYYAQSSPLDHIRRDAVPVEMTEEKMNSVREKVSRIVLEMEKFYEAPYMEAATFDKPHPKAFPCRMCEYIDVCHDGKRLEGEFTYKRRRSE